MSPDFPRFTMSPDSPQKTTQIKNVENRQIDRLNSILSPVALFAATLIVAMSLHTIPDEATRRLILAPPPRVFTQGLIFSCGVAEGYEGCATFGLAVTARCDAANDKVRVYNYLPVVSLDDWLHRDGRAILAQRLNAEALGGLRSVLRDSGFSPRVLETENPELIFRELFPDEAIEKPIINGRKRAKELLKRYALSVAAAESSPHDRLTLKIMSDYPKQVDALIEELVRQDLSGYYFLEQADAHGGDCGFVILVREIHAIPQRLAKLITDGLDCPTFAAMCGEVPGFVGRLQMSADDVAMPVGILRSPNIEHLMQSFALLFSRIGLDDPAPEYISSLWGRQPSVLETKL
jgi:hypothetical protein